MATDLESLVTLHEQMRNQMVESLKAARPEILRAADPTAAIQGEERRIEQLKTTLDAVVVRKEETIRRFDEEIKLRKDAIKEAEKGLEVGRRELAKAVRGRPVGGSPVEVAQPETPVKKTRGRSSKDDIEPAS